MTVRVPQWRGPTPRCGHRRHTGPYYLCNRPQGHTGRHSFAWYHLGGLVRAVWGDR